MVVHTVIRKCVEQQKHQKKTHVFIQGLQPSEKRAYAVCKGYVLHGPGKPEPSTIKWDGLAYGRCPATFFISIPTGFGKSCIKHCGALQLATSW